MRRSATFLRVAVSVAVASSLVAACSGGDDGAESGVDDTAVPLEDDGSPVGGATDDEALEITTGQEQEAVSRPGFDLDAVLAADPNCPDPVTGEPLRIGYAADLGEIGGPADRPGSEAAVHLAKLINCSGGIGGTPVDVIVQDISGDALRTRAGVRSLLDSNVHVLLGPPFASEGFRVLQQTKGRIGVIFTGSTEPALGNDASLAYLVAFNDTQGATAGAQFALTSGWRRAVTLSFPGPYFGYNSLVFSGAFTAGGGEVIGDYPFVPGETEDFAEIAAAIAADPPDVIFSPMFASQTIQLREQLTAAGVTDVEFLQPDAFEATGGYTLAGNDGIYHATHMFPGEGSRAELLMGSISSANGVPPAAPSMAALAGDAMAVIADAYLRVGTMDPTVLGAAIADSQGVQGITGVLSYEGTGLPTKPIYIQHVEGGGPALAATIGG